MPPAIEIRLNPQSVFRFIVVVIALLTLLHLLGAWIRWQFGTGLFGTVRMFNTDQEANIPSFLSALNMVFAAALLFVIGAAERDSGLLQRLSWLGLGLVFLFLPFDELFAVHERLNAPLRRALGTSGVLAFAWVIPYAAFVLVVGGLAARLLWSLAARTRGLILTGGAVFLGGAIGLEMLGAHIAETSGKASLEYFAEATLEEVFEMSGVAIFTLALLEHLAGLRVAVSVEPATAPEAAGLVPTPARTAVPEALAGMAMRSRR